MKKLLDIDTVFTCPHGESFRVTPNREGIVTVKGKQLLTKEALIGAKIKSEKNPTHCGVQESGNPPIVACRTILAVIGGFSPKVHFQHQMCLHEGARGMTNGFPIGVWAVKSIPQEKVVFEKSNVNVPIPVAHKEEQKETAIVRKEIQKKKTHQIQITMLYERNQKPVREICYEVTFPDKKTCIKGKLNEDGKACIVGLDSGQYQIRFPDLPDCAWRGEKESAQNQPLPATYKIQEGDCLSTIGKSYHVSWEWLWEKNEELRNKRKEPNRIQVGDILKVPTREKETQSSKELILDQENTFLLLNEPTAFFLQLKSNGLPTKNQRCACLFDGVLQEEKRKWTTDNEGNLQLDGEKQLWALSNTKEIHVLTGLPNGEQKPDNEKKPPQETYHSFRFTMEAVKANDEANTHKPNEKKIAVNEEGLKRLISKSFAAKFAEDPDTVKSILTLIERTIEFIQEYYSKKKPSPPEMHRLIFKEFSAALGLFANAKNNESLNAIVFVIEQFITTIKLKDILNMKPSKAVMKISSTAAQKLLNGLEFAKINSCGIALSSLFIDLAALALSGAATPVSGPATPATLLLFFITACLVLLQAIEVSEQCILPKVDLKEER